MVPKMKQSMHMTWPFNIQSSPTGPDSRFQPLCPPSAYKFTYKVHRSIEPSPLFNEIYLRKNNGSYVFLLDGVSKAFGCNSNIESSDP